MKLGQLKTAIRDHEGAPNHWVVFRGKHYLMTAQKGRMLTFLDEAFPEGRTVETGLTFKDGVLQPEMASAPLPITQEEDNESENND